MDWWRLGRWALLVVAVVGGVLLMGRVAVIAFRSYKGPTAAAAFTVATAADRKVDPPHRRAPRSACRVVARC